MKELAEFLWWCWDPLGNGEGGAKTEVGVGTGVFWVDETAVPDRIGCLCVGTSPVYTWPSSDGRNESVEQNPSDDEIINVKPSLDL